MLKVGITGGIGSGKTVVCRVFATLGIPVFSADDAAKYLMEYDKGLKQAIIQLLGPAAYLNGKPDRAKIAEIVYKDNTKLQGLNAIVHPATIRYGEEWMVANTAFPYTIKEAAIFFESGSDKSMDVMVGVYAPKALRLMRAMQRGNMPQAKIEGIMAQQMDEEEKMQRCDHVITNDDTAAILPQVLQLHRQFISRIDAGMTV